jgi:translation elongation factor EF-G
MYSVSRPEIFNSFLNGFNQATLAGPLCEEPMQGACFIIQNIEIVKEENA